MNSRESYGKRLESCQVVSDRNEVFSGAGRDLDGFKEWNGSPMSGKKVWIRWSIQPEREVAGLVVRLIHSFTATMGRCRIHRGFLLWMLNLGDV